MVFKWKISRPAFHSAANGIEVMHPGIETEFETGSIGEAHGIFTDSGTALSQMFGSTLMAGVSGLALAIDGGEANEAQGETNEQTPARRGRKPKDKSQPDPTTANAPDPLPIPGAEAPPLAPAIDTALNANGIPAFLAAPPAPPTPPAPPAPPPTGVLAGKIAVELDRRAGLSADGGQALADWLATSGITVKGATYTEAVQVLRLQADEKLTGIAGQLGVTA